MLDINPENYKSENILSKVEILNLLEKLRAQGKKIGLSSGCFGLLQPGHITYLEEAKKRCDVLIVAVAKDDYIKKTKEPGRPVFSEHLRAYLISKLKPVDYVILDDAITSLDEKSFDIVEFIKPDVYIKGADWKNKQDPRVTYHKNLLESFGGKMIFTETEKLSVTDILKYIKETVSV